MLTSDFHCWCSVFLPSSSASSGAGKQPELWDRSGAGGGGGWVLGGSEWTGGTLWAGCGLFANELGDVQVSWPVSRALCSRLFGPCVEKGALERSQGWEKVSWVGSAPKRASVFLSHRESCSLSFPSQRNADFCSWLNLVQTLPSQIECYTLLLSLRQ